jgi:hypothetical protein
MGETWLLIKKPVNHHSKYVATAKYSPVAFQTCSVLLVYFSVISFCNRFFKLTAIRLDKHEQ